MKKGSFACLVLVLAAYASAAAQDPWKPYSPPRVEREDVFSFTQKPSVKLVSKDRYEITFAVKGNCDVTVGIVDKGGKVVRHLASGVLGANAPEPFQKNSLSQKLIWNGKDDLDYYPKNPDDLKVRVSLGLKPVFDRNLGGTSPKNIPGKAWGIAADGDGVYVFSRGSWGRFYCRRFDHDGRYVATLVPPPANLPESKLQGMGYLEYEPGKRTLHSTSLGLTVQGGGASGNYLPISNDERPDICNPAAVKGRLYYMSSGAGATGHKGFPCLSYIHTDGSTDMGGCTLRPFAKAQATHFSAGGQFMQPSLAGSPDGKWIYVCDRGSKHQSSNVVYRGEADGREEAKAFIGELNKPGADNAHLNQPSSVDTDSEGRVYVCDSHNMRIQVCSPEGKYLGTIRVERPDWLGIHKKTNELYVMHQARVRGKSTSRITKFTAFPKLEEAFHHDGIGAAVVALDSWTSKPRIWTGSGRDVRVWEETGKEFRKIVDFVEDAKKEEGANHARWDGGIRNFVACDPTRAQVYYVTGAWGAQYFDIPSGRLLGQISYPSGRGGEFVFDKKGYMHQYIYYMNYPKSVIRFDPGRSNPSHVHKDIAMDHVKCVSYEEVPYDYGIARGKFEGVIPVKAQPGAKGFQDGLGVNMRGDVVAQCNIHYKPKGFDVNERGALGTLGHSGSAADKYRAMQRVFLETSKRGVEWYYIRYLPGIPIDGATVWTYDRTGELRDECAVIAGLTVNGTAIDEDGKLYLTFARQRLYDGRIFLAGKGGIIGDPERQSLVPFTGTFAKTRGKKVRILLNRGATVPLDEKIDRPLEVGGGYNNGAKSGQECWVEGAEWLYAGASPIVRLQPCTCPTMRAYTDWYKRSFVPEAYRHSIGVLDTNGNLVMHIGRYGNLDSGSGAKSAIPIGGDNIAIAFNSFVSATDDYLVFDDHGERLTVLKLDYHAEETAPIAR